MDKISFFSLLLGNGFLTTLICYITKHILENRANAKLEELKSKFSIELEGYRAGYKQCLDENNIRFSWWHSEQANALKETFAALSRLQLSLGSFTSPIQREPKDEKERIEYYQAKLDKVITDYSSVMDVWFPSRLFFIFPDKDMNPEIQNLLDECKSAISKYRKALMSHEIEKYVEAEDEFQRFTSVLEELQTKCAKQLTP